jgi:diguanylate cyclase (GGDEF)-like protein
VLLLGAFVAIQLLHHTGISWAFVLPPLVLFLHPLRRGLLYLLLIAVLITAAFVLGHVQLMLRDHEPFEFWGSIIAVTAVSALLVRDLGRTVAAVTTVAFRDPLTNLFQRDLFEELARRQIAAAVREQASCALLELDVDNLKLVNDRAGHVAGDRVLRAVAGVLTDELRGVDLSARFGGDEFVVLLPGLDQARALEVAQRLHDRITRHPELIRLRSVALVTASIGIAAYPQHGTRLDELFAAADAALLAAKTAGKNRLMVAPSQAPP